MEFFKTFKEIANCDTSWTGGRRDFYPAEEKIDKAINDHCKKFKVRVKHVQYSYVNHNVQEGADPRNTTRSIYLIAGVTFYKKWFF